MLIILAILIGLRADDVIHIPYSVVFIPLWIWNILVLVGVVMGVVRWIYCKEMRYVHDTVLVSRSHTPLRYSTGGSGGMTASLSF